MRQDRLGWGGVGCGGAGLDETGRYGMARDGVGCGGMGWGRKGGWRSSSWKREELNEWFITAPTATPGPNAGTEGDFNQHKPIPR